MGIKRTILIVLDGVGCGELPDAGTYGDLGSNTLGNLAKATKGISLPTLQSWGLGNLTPISGVATVPANQTRASFGKCVEQSLGKDTTSGHWEMAGVVVDKAFATFPTGFPQSIVDRWVKENGLAGVLGNIPASGTEIIEKLGEEHLKTGKPILYTSADSVWQVAAHEESFGLERLYAICKSARKICDELQISRVIARPFVGKTAKDFKRTHHRKDLSQTPPRKTMMELLVAQGISTLGIGKIWNIYNGAGIQKSIETEDNADGMRVLLEELKKTKEGLIFVNLIDFDMLYGHRRDVPGFSASLQEFDANLAKLQAALNPEDLVLISADHGNDPTYRGTDHTREYVPILAHRPGKTGKDLGVRKSFADIGQTIVHALTGKPALNTGESFLEAVM